MTMIKYTSIKNLYNFDESMFEGDISKIKGVALNKIDGSNFGIEIKDCMDLLDDAFIFTDLKGFGYRIQSRNNMLGEGHNHYNVDNLIRQYDDGLLRIVRFLVKWYAGTNLKIKRIVFFGEVYGGYYKTNITKDQFQIRSSKKVQGRVSYTPNNELTFFDIYVEREDEGFYLNWWLVKNLFDDAKIPYPTIMKEESLWELMRFDPKFEDPEYKKFNLSKIENNFSEGIVIKPVKELKYRNERFIFKNKIEDFQERTQKKKEPRAEIEEKYLDVINFITENRIHNVYSHIVDVPKQYESIPIILKEFVSDVLKDYIKEYNLELDEKDEKSIRKYINNKSILLIKKFLRSE